MLAVKHGLIWKLTRNKHVKQTTLKPYIFGSPVAPKLYAYPEIDDANFEGAL